MTDYSGFFQGIPDVTPVPTTQLSINNLLVGFEQWAALPTPEPAPERELTPLEIREAEEKRKAFPWREI